MYWQDDAVSWLDHMRYQALPDASKREPALRYKATIHGSVKCVYLRSLHISSKSASVRRRCYKADQQAQTDC
jgi:hypothetical protein